MAANTTSPDDIGSTWYRPGIVYIKAELLQWRLVTSAALQISILMNKSLNNHQRRHVFMNHIILVKQSAISHVLFYKLQIAEDLGGLD